MRQVVRICIYIIYTFRYSFIGPIYGQRSFYITLRTTKQTPLIFWGFSEGVGWEQFSEIIQSLRGFMGYTVFSI